MPVEIDKAIVWRRLKRLTLENLLLTDLERLMKRAPVLQEVALRGQFIEWERKAVASQLRLISRESLRLVDIRNLEGVREIELVEAEEGRKVRVLKKEEEIQIRRTSPNSE